MSISMKVEIDAVTITIVIVNSLKNSNMASITIIPFFSDKKRNTSKIDSRLTL